MHNKKDIFPRLLNNAAKESSHNLLAAEINWPLLYNSL